MGDVKSLDVEIKVEKNPAIYFSGEDVRIKITLRNNTKMKEDIGWGSADIICEQIKAKAIDARQTKHEESLPKRTQIFCVDAEILPDQQIEFWCTISVPFFKHPLPTFRGQRVVYTNKIKVAVARVGVEQEYFFLPIRVLPVRNAPDRSEIVRNPFAPIEETSYVDQIMQNIDHLTQSRKSIGFEMKRAEDAKIVMLTLPKQTFKLGDDVCGYLDWCPDVESSCVQYSAVLETVETVKKAANSDTLGPLDKAISQTAPVCAFTKDSAFRLNIPHTATPSFENDFVSHKWRLRMTFLLTNQNYSTQVRQFIAESTAPKNMPIQTYTWSLDIDVLPCRPENAALLEQNYRNIAIGSMSRLHR